MVEHRARSQRAVADVVTRFLEHTREEDAPLASVLAALDPDGLHELGGILGRFHTGDPPELDQRRRLLAIRILRRLRTVTPEALGLTNTILDYLDLNTGGRLSAREFELCIEVFEIFADSESPDHLLSLRELQMLYAVLCHFDTDDSARLESKEIRWLRHALSDPPAFMQRMRLENPHVRRLLES